jgi:hypothetical protein
MEKNGKPPASRREAKLAEALRANLRRRKAVDRPVEAPRPAEPPKPT